MCDKNSALLDISDQEVLLKGGRESTVPSNKTFTSTCDMSLANSQQELYNKFVGVYNKSKDPVIIDEAIKIMNEYFDAEINKSFNIIKHYMESYGSDFLLSNGNEFPTTRQNNRRIFIDIRNSEKIGLTN